jgi:prefoldin subunit 5
MSKVPLESMAEHISQLRRSAEALQKQAQGIQAVERNLVRLLSSVKMLELNISDVKKLV